MKTNKKPATVPSTDGSNTTPQRKETMNEIPDKAEKDENNVSDEGLDDEDDDDMQDDDSISMMRHDSEISLPRATVNQLIMEKLPVDARISTNSKDTIIRLCMSFLNALAAKANNVCGAKNKKTVCPDHVIDAMVEMHLDHYLAKMANPKFTTKQSNKFLAHNSKK